MKLILRVLVFAAAFYTVYALCNTCSSITGLACVANDQFQVCSNGLPVAPSMQCPSGTVCTAEARVCSPVGTVLPSCNRCGTCSTSNMFACTGYNTFAACFGTNVPDTTNITCPGTTVCNVDSATICVDPATEGIGATCPLVTTTTAAPSTTPNPAIDPQAYCRNVGTFGRYDIPTDNTCKTYVYCALVNSTWIGAVYECPGSTLFNATSRYCGVEIPPRCAQSTPSN